MKVGIIAVLLEGEKTGIGTYTYNLVQSLKVIDPQNEYFTVSRRKLNSLQGGGDNQIIIPTFDLLNWFQSGLFAWQLFILPIKLRQHRELVLVHDPLNLACFAFFNIPFKKVVTIHDIAPLVNKHYFGKIFVSLHQIVMPGAVKKADIIITDSDFSKKEIVRYLHANPDKIRVIYPGINAKFHPLPPVETRATLEKYKIPQYFILYVGATHRQKNVQALLKAFTLIRKEIRHKLVIVGPKIYGGRGELSRMIKELKIEDDVIFTGYIADNELPGFYNAASLFVFPSLYEGFGLPPLEAMACGTPVISSNRTSLPEVVGDAGLMVDPDDIDGLSKAMVRLLSDEELRKDMIKRGLERAKLFSSEQTAIHTLEVYREVLGIK